MILTILSGLEPAWRERFTRFVLVNLAFCAGSLPLLLLVWRLNIDVRREVYATQPPATPAVVLVPNRGYVLFPWQSQVSHAYPGDFTRNGLDAKGPVLYGDGELPNSVELACQLGGRHVYRWTQGGKYAEQPCS